MTIDPVGRRGRPTARRIIAYLCSRGWVEIRVLARDRSVLPRPYELDPNDPADTDFVARIYMISNVCHTFAGTGAGLSFLRERAARFELGWRWSSSGPASRRWINATVAELGDDYASLLRRITDKSERALLRKPIAPWAPDLGLDGNSSPDEWLRALRESEERAEPNKDDAGNP